MTVAINPPMEPQQQFHEKKNYILLNAK